MARWVVETRRDAKGRGVTARAVVGRSPGVTIVGTAGPDRVVVEATHLAARGMAEAHGEVVAVEREAPQPTGGGAARRGSPAAQPRSSGAMVSRGGHVPWTHRG